MPVKIKQYKINCNMSISIPPVYSIISCKIILTFRTILLLYSLTYDFNNIIFHKENTFNNLITVFNLSSDPLCPFNYYTELHASYDSIHVRNPMHRFLSNPTKNCHSRYIYSSLLLEIRATISTVAIFVMIPSK